MAYQYGGTYYSSPPYTHALLHVGGANIGTLGIFSLVLQGPS